MNGTASHSKLESKTLPIEMEKISTYPRYRLKNQYEGQSLGRVPLSRYNF